MRLFLFPYAGGAPAAFNKWPAEFPNSIETHIVHYPGRGSRFNETPIKSIDILVEEISHAIQPLLDKPFFFFGHSMGSILAFELSHQLKLQPQILFVSACGAPQLPDPNPSIHLLPDSEFIKSLQEFNGLPADAMNNPELMQLLLPTLRTDFEAFGNYAYRSSEPRLTCPVIALGGSDDAHVRRDRLEGWAYHTSGNFKAHYFPGDHFFINAARQLVTGAITDEVTSLYENR